MSDGKPGRLSEADLTPGSVKSTMIMEAAQDIRALERDLRLVESYRDRDAAGAGDLEGMCLRFQAACLQSGRVVKDFRLMSRACQAFWRIEGDREGKTSRESSFGCNEAVGGRDFDAVQQLCTLSYYLRPFFLRTLMTYSRN